MKMKLKVGHYYKCRDVNGTWIGQYIRYNSSRRFFKYRFHIIGFIERGEYLFTDDYCRNVGVSSDEIIREVYDLTLELLGTK
jgi:hypothetical protein